VHILNMYIPGSKISNYEEIPGDMHHNLPPQDWTNGYNPSAITCKTLPTMLTGSTD
jgi:hypothetical protein